MNFQNKIVIVTGSSRGIGAAIAKAFAAEGASVIVNYIQNEDAAEKVVADCKKAGGDALAIKADVTSEADIHGLIEQTLDEFGRIDVLVSEHGRREQQHAARRNTAHPAIEALPAHRRAAQLANRAQFFCDIPRCLP